MLISQRKNIFESKKIEQRLGIRVDFLLRKKSCVNNRYSFERNFYKKIILKLDKRITVSYTFNSKKGINCLLR